MSEFSTSRRQSMNRLASASKKSIEHTRNLSCDSLKDYTLGGSIALFKQPTPKTARFQKRIATPKRGKDKGKQKDKSHLDVPTDLSGMEELLDSDNMRYLKEIFERYA